MKSDLDALFSKAKDLAVAYRESALADPRLPSADYHTMLERLVAPLPEEGMDAVKVITELADVAEPGLMPMTGPRFFGCVIGASHPAGVAADWLVSAWGQNTAYHTPTPATAAIEEIAERWLVDILDLPRGSSIGFTTGATIANATASQRRERAFCSKPAGIPMPTDCSVRRRSPCLSGRTRIHRSSRRCN